MCLCGTPPRPSNNPKIPPQTCNLKSPQPSLTVLFLHICLNWLSRCSEGSQHAPTSHSHKDIAAEAPDLALQLRKMAELFRA